MVLCSSREIVSLKTFLKIAGPPVFNSGSNEPSHALQFKWLDNTFNRVYWLEIQSCWYFRPLLWTSTPLTFSLVHLPPPPLPVWISTGKCIHAVYNGEGRGSGCVEGIYSTGVICTLYTVYLTRFRTYKFALPPQTEPRRGGGLRQINTCRQVPVCRSIFKKRRHLGFGVFLDIWPMFTIKHSGVAQLVVHQLDVRHAQEGFSSWVTGILVSMQR